MFNAIIILYKRINLIISFDLNQYEHNLFFINDNKTDIIFLGYSASSNRYFFVDTDTNF